MESSCDLRYSRILQDKILAEQKTDTTDILEAMRIVDFVDGWLTENEGRLLFNLAKEATGVGVIVEIGSWKGKSTICLAKGSKAGKGSKVYAIDPHNGSDEIRKMQGEVNTLDEFRRNITLYNVEDIIIPLIKTSLDAAKNFDQRVELVFVDGAHDYDLVKLDFDLWFPKLNHGGIIAFHDTITWPGPKKVVEEFMHAGNRFRDILQIDSITYGVKI
jgi:MMP 1-O-methyltransferase